MAYEKHTWADGEVITAERLNALENGVGTAVGQKGADGAPGKDGAPGAKGADGQSAYALWKAQEGNAGKSEAEFLASLKGQKGTDGAPGKDGAPGAKGADGKNGAAGVGVKSISLTKDASGAITAGTWVDTANASHAITITTAGA